MTTCHRCPEPAAVSLGTEYLCAGHADAILDPIRERWVRAEGFIGWGLSTGARPDYGPGWHDLTCGTCGATWVGHSHEACGWCERMRTAAIAHQAELVLAAPDVDPDDDRYEAAMSAWADRLATAVVAEIITRTQATRAWSRHTGADSAAA